MPGPRQRKRPEQKTALPPSHQTQISQREDPADDDGTALPTPPPPEPAAEGILFSHGIHQVALPATGLTVAEVRETLIPLLNIDPDAVAVVRGQRIENPEEFVLEEGVDLVSFVKPSSVKGATKKAERIELCNGVSTLHLARSQKKVSTEAVIATIQQHALVGLHDEALPSTVRWRVDCDQVTVFVLEFEPEIRSLPWVADDSPKPYGPGAKYEQRALATPYVVVKVVFRNRKLLPQAELFYRNQPLRSLDDTLYWSNLLNVSPNSYDCTAWVCTQHVGHEFVALQERLGREPSLIEQIDALHRHVWWGGFNRSSEMHEGKSCFSKANEDGVDERVTDVDRWAKETAADWRFILDVEWQPTELDVRRLITEQFERLDLPVDLSDPTELTTAVIPKRRRTKKGA